MSDDWIDSGDYEIPEGADGDWWGGITPPLTSNEIAIEALSALGIEYAGDDEVVVDIANVEDVSELRGVRFASVVDAVQWLFDTGLLSIGGRVVEITDIEYTVTIPSETGGGS